MDSIGRKLNVLVCSLVFAGLGQFYNKQYFKSAIVLSVYLICLVLMYPLKLSLCYFDHSILYLIFVSILIYSYIDAFLVANKSIEKPKPIVLTAYIIAFVLMNLGITTFAPIKAYKIPTLGMHPTIQIGDLFFADMSPFHDSLLKRGTIVLISDPMGTNKLLIKRVIALPSDTVEIKNDTLLLNHFVQKEKYAYFSSLIDPNSENAFKLRNYNEQVIPSGKIFLLGDNRNNSLDSRYWGPLDISLIKGKPLYIYFSFKNLFRISKYYK